MSNGKKLSEILAPLLGEKLSQQLTGLVELAGALVVAIAAAAQAVSPLIESGRVKEWADLVTFFEELPTKSKQAMRQALAEGWFFGWHDSLQSLVGLIESLSNRKDEDVDQTMMAYYRLNLAAFSKELIEAYPARAAPIEAAIQSHLRMDESGFLLSVPVFIAQADGILADTIGVSQPIKNSASALKRRYGADAEVLDYLTPLLELNDSPFAMSAKARSTQMTEGALNRHQVMHGERSDYGTEKDSLKAFSFLAFVGLHVPTILAADATPRKYDQHDEQSPPASKL